jgi:hypothetical protein
LREGVVLVGLLEEESLLEVVLQDGGSQKTLVE